MKRFFPTTFNFFQAFDRQADNLMLGASFFQEAVSKGEITESERTKMREIEHLGDDITYEIIDNLNKTFITPFDREDIHSLAKKLDDVNDMMRTILSRMRVYKIKRADSNLIEFAGLIKESAIALDCAIKNMKNQKNTNLILKSCMEINRLEGEGDKLRDKVFEELFEKEKDPIEIIKWKEIYQNAETVLDICKVAAHTIESIMVKQA